MPFHLSTDLRLLELAGRVMPSVSVVSAAGSLTVRGTPVAALKLSAIGGSGGTINLRIAEGSTNYGTYAITGNVTLQLASHSSTIDVDLGGKTLPGNLSVDLGRGGTNLLATPPVSIYNGAVNGSIRLNNGNGAETWSLGKQNGAFSVLSQGDVFVSALANSPTPAGDSLLVTSGSRLAGGLTCTNVDNVLIGELGGSATVAGNVLVNSSNSALAIYCSQFGDVYGNLTIIGTSHDDFIQLGDGITPSSGTVHGNVVASLGEGTIGDFVTSSISSVINGSLSILDGNGPDVILVGGTVNGASSFILGNGNNSLSMTGSVNGDLRVSTGNGNDDLSTFTGAIGGRVDLNLGNGDNTFSFAGSVSGASLVYTGGGGSDSVTVVGTHSASFRAFLGAGRDSLDLSGASFVSAMLDFGNDNDTDDYIPLPVLPATPVIILNYP